MRTCISILLSFFILLPALHARQVKLTLLHSAHLRGRLLPTEPGGAGKDLDAQAGLFQVASLLGQLRVDNPETLFVDCGGSLCGGALNELSGGVLMPKALKALGCTVLVPGLRDLAAGVKGLPKKLPLLAANLRQGAAGEVPPPLAEFKEVRVDGLRVCIVGLIRGDVRNYIRKEYLEGVFVEDPVLTLRRLLPEIRAGKPDVVVVVFHGDWKGGAKALMEAAPGVDLFIASGGSSPVGLRKSGGSVYAASGTRPGWAGIVELTYDTVQRKLSRVEGRLVPCGKSFSADPALAHVLHPSLGEARSAARQIIAPAMPDAQTLTEQYGRGVLRKLSADFLLHTRRLKGPRDTGALREDDLWALLPESQRLGTLHLLPAEINEIIGEYAAAFSRQPLQVVGGKIKEGKLKDAQGNPLHPRKRYTLVLPENLLASAGGRCPGIRRIADLPLSRLKLSALTEREILRKSFEEATPEP